MFGRIVSVTPLRVNDINSVQACENSIGNTLMEWDEFVHKQDGNTFHERKELSVAKLQPEISITFGANSSNHFVFEYEEYIVLDDSENNYKGYVQTSEFFSSAERAYGRLSTRLTRLLNDSFYTIGRTWDDRKTWLSKFEEGDFLNNVFACELIKDGHRVKMLYVHAASCIDDNSKPMLYI